MPRKVKKPRRGPTPNEQPSIYVTVKQSRDPFRSFNINFGMDDYKQVIRDVLALKEHRMKKQMKGANNA